MIAQEERFKRSLPVKFTQDELRGKADELADKVARRESLEEEKKRVTADYKARIDVCTSEVNLLARHITEKCEYQQVECQSFLDAPDYGKKMIYRCDTGEFVGTETMTPVDRQIVLKFDIHTDERQTYPLATPSAADVPEEAPAPEITPEWEAAPPAPEQPNAFEVALTEEA